MNDMSRAIVPKSDQLNADDLLTGPITIKIAAVSIKAGQEQPVSLSYENDGGKPYKPCKSMCRVLVAAWGPDASKYTGRALTLYCDPKVRWGGMEVGGIRISHMSDIRESLTMALTVTRGNKKPFVVKPIASGSPKAATTQTPDSESAGSSAQQREAASSASSAATDTLAKITETLGYASETLKNRFTARLATSGVKAAAELSAEAQEGALTWLKAQIDREAATTT